MRKNIRLGGTVMVYYGITIGPIVETLAQATTPGSLWYASYMFSKLTEKICEKLSEIDDIQIISPYYTVSENKEKDLKNQPSGKCEGYGKYHDRILFAIREDDVLCKESRNNKDDFFTYNNNLLDNIMDEFIEDIVIDLQYDEVGFNNDDSRKVKEISFIKNYLQVSHISMYDDDSMIVEKHGVINALNYYLDCLEMSRTIFTQQQDYLNGTNLFQRLFYSVDEKESSHGKNVNIKNSKLMKPFISSENFTLLHKDTKEIRSMEDIARYTLEKKTKEGLRKRHYVAIVQADGDNMGKYIKSIEKRCENRGLNLKQEMFHFSKKCMEYTTKSADLIMEYGGIVIFAGGDDLLFLAPIQPSKDKNIYKLIKEISDTFDSVFSAEINQQVGSGKRENKLSLSFGVSMNTEKFPLYEAFTAARNLLFNEAKAGIVKNNIAITLRKGNSVSFGFNMPITSNAFQKYCELVGKYYGLAEKIEEEQKRLNSVIYLFENWGNMFAYALEKNDESVDNVFKNLFDHEIHEYTDEFLKDIKQLAKCVYCQYKSNLTKPIMNTSVVSENGGVKCIIALLHMAKFMIEKDIDEE